MIRWSRKRRALLSDKLPDLANLVIGGFVVGQVIGTQPLSWWLLFLGLTLWPLLVGAAIWIAGGSDD